MISSSYTQGFIIHILWLSYSVKKTNKLNTKIKKGIKREKKEKGKKREQERVGKEL